MRKIPLRAGVLLLAVIGTFFVAPTPPASADTMPDTQYSPVSITDMNFPSYLLSEPSGSVTVGCSGGTTGTKRISAAGTVTQDLPNAAPYPNTCGRNAVVGADGTLFTVMANAMGWPQIQAIKNGAVQWTHSFSCPSMTRGMVIGTNGNVYALEWCNGQNSVIGFEPAPAPGNTTPIVVLNVNVASNVVDGGIAAYTNGLVLRTETGVQYVSYSGNVNTPVALNALGGGYQMYYDATMDGRVIVPVRASTTNQQLCGSDPYVIGGVYAFEPSGQVWGYNSLPACSHLHATRPMPNGGALIHFDSPQGGVVGNPRVQHVRVVDGNGDDKWTIDPAPNLSGVNITTVTFLVDSNGNVVMERRIRYVLNANGTTYQFPALQLAILGGNSGAEVGAYEVSGSHDTPSGSGYTTYGFAETSIGTGRWFLPLVQCTVVNSCDNGSAKLYAFMVPGLQMDYPRGAILSPAPTKDYAALGDSYSSGEGVPSFISGTDTAGPPENRCHRSNSAYGPLLSGNPATGWELGTVNERSTFVACAGATVQNVMNGQFDESAQVDVLDSNTDVVTISAGGNDVPFKEFVIACLFVDCSDPAIKQPYFANIANIGSSLNTLYTDNQKGIHHLAPNAKVYALGYPQLLPTQGCTQTDGWMVFFSGLMQEAHNGNAVAINTVVTIGRIGKVSDSNIYGAIAAGVVEFNASEVATARSLVVQLNGAISDTVASINQPWLVYVDPLASGSPFLGHELCTSQPFFNGLDGANIPYSYHPNSHGQDAYRKLVLLYL